MFLRSPRSGTVSKPILHHTAGQKSAPLGRGSSGMRTIAAKVPHMTAVAPTIARPVPSICLSAAPVPCPTSNDVGSISSMIIHPHARTDCPFTQLFIQRFATTACRFVLVRICQVALHWLTILAAASALQGIVKWRQQLLRPQALPISSRYVHLPPPH